MMFLYVLSLLIIGFTITFGTVILPGKPTPFIWKQCDSIVWRNNWTPGIPSGSCVNQFRKGQPVYVDRQGPWCKWCPNIGKNVRNTLMLSFFIYQKFPEYHRKWVHDWSYSRLPITRTFKGNQKRFKLSGVRVTGSSNKIAECKVKNSFYCTVNILITFNCRNVKWKLKDTFRLQIRT